jgi:alpha-L-fucosidase
MSLTRRNALKLLAAALPATALRTSFAQVATPPNPAIPEADPSKTQPPPPAPTHPLPPAPAHIPAPENFGVAPGPFQPTWDSLSAYQVPDWYRDAKLGIWAHWGPQCQPEDGDWYAQKMYKPTDAVYKFHLEKYGHPSKFGFKDVINEWKADQWDPEHLISLYKRAGAKYFAAMANHHDNTDMFDSTYQPWNSVRIGPRKDIVGGWERAARAAGLRFAVTCHGDRAWSWYQAAQGSDPSGPLAGVPYDGITPKDQGAGKWWEGLDPQDLYAQYHILGRYNWAQTGTPPLDPHFIEKFFNRTIDLINKYHPDLVYFDDTILPIYPASDIGLRIAAYLYNTNLARNGKLEAVITGKGLNAAQRKALVLDVERGVTSGGETLPWQTDTCIGEWHYQRRLFEQHRYKSPLQVVQMFVDIVSKNGNLMLNIPIRGNGTIDDDERKVLEALASWIAPNGEGIYATRPFSIYGEGPAAAASQPRGQFGGARDVRTYTAQDIRYTCKGDTVYAFLMGWPEDRKASLPALAQNSPHFPKQIAKVELLGNPAPLPCTRDPAALHITLPDRPPTEFAHCLKISPA